MFNLSSYLQDNAPISILQQINCVGMRQPIQKLPINADNPIANLKKAQQQRNND